METVGSSNRRGSDRRRNGPSSLLSTARPAWTIAAILCSICASACGDVTEEGAFPTRGSKARPLPRDPSPKLLLEDLGGRKELRFGATPFLGDEGTQQAFGAIAAALTEQLGVPVRFVPCTTYQQLIDRTVNGELDIIQLSPLSFLKARKQLPDLRLVASSTSFGTDSYSSLLVVRADSELLGLDDVKRSRSGRAARVRVALVDEHSASGFLLPYLAMHEAGIDLARDVEVQFKGSHEATIDAVLQQRADIAAVSSGTLNATRRGEVLGPAELRILFKAGRIPYDAVCVAPGLSQSVAERVAVALGRLDTRTPEGRAALRLSRGMTGWIAANHEHYARLEASWERARAHVWQDWTAQLAGQPTVTGEGAP